MPGQLELTPMPEPFYWGVATAAFQIEGAVAEDGRGASIWDVLCRRPGAIFSGENADLACDHFQRYREDVEWLRRLGVNAYRLSLSWPRLLPDGRRFNSAGLDFYKRLLDELHAAGIEPFVTLYHWDLPQALEEEGGWAVRSTAEAFRRYAAIAAEGLKGRVRHWMTFNEPWASAVYGYYQGIQAPGRRETPETTAQVIHHLLLAHGYAVQAVREFAAPESEVGIVLNPCCTRPASGKPADAEAAETLWRLENDWWLDPLYHGRYPEGGWRGLYRARPAIAAGDLETIAAPTDFLGLNLYTSQTVSCDWSAFHGFRTDLPPDRKVYGGLPLIPETIPETVDRILDRWPVKALYIAENGVAGRAETPDASGRVEDHERVEYLALHLEEVEKLRRRRVPLKGYFHWTLMDNFEWIWGFSSRFGLLRTDPRTLERIPKASFDYYRDFLARIRAVETPPQRVRR